MQKVSIILPTYNGERFIKESVESVLNQTYTDWELIIVNDCSTDKTLNIINEYKTDSRIKIISNKSNLKLPASLNIGFSEAKGDYYTWTSDDNMYKPEAIEKMTEYLNKNPACDLVSYNFDFISENGTFENQFTDFVFNRTMLQLTKQCNVGACFMYRKEIADNIGKYDENMYCVEDYDYWCRIALKGNIHYISENLYKYRKTSDSLTATKQEMIYRKTMNVRFKYLLPIMNKLELSDKEKIKTILEYYCDNNNPKWIEIARSINNSLTLKYQCKYMLKKIFNGFLP